MHPGRRSEQAIDHGDGALRAHASPLVSHCPIDRQDTIAEDRLDLAEAATEEALEP